MTAQALKRSHGLGLMTACVCRYVLVTVAMKQRLCSTTCTNVSETWLWQTASDTWTRKDCLTDTTAFHRTFLYKSQPVAHNTAVEWSSDCCYLGRRGDKISLHPHKNCTIYWPSKQIPRTLMWTCTANCSCCVNETLIQERCSLQRQSKNNTSAANPRPHGSV